MKKICRLCLLLLAFSLFAGMCVPVMAQEMHSLAVSSGCVTLDAKSPLMGSQKLLDTSKAVILYEMGSQTLVEWNPSWDRWEANAGQNEPQVYLPWPHHRTRL